MAKRSLSLLRAPVGKSGLVAICDGKLRTLYRIRRIKTDIGGVAWEFWRFVSATPYHVRIDDAVQNSTCDCIAFYMNMKCRHLSAILALRAKGLLGDANV